MFVLKEIAVKHTVQLAVALDTIRTVMFIQTVNVFPIRTPPPRADQTTALPTVPRKAVNRKALIFMLTQLYTPLKRQRLFLLFRHDIFTI